MLSSFLVCCKKCALHILNHRRFSSNTFRLLPMPRLSPSMTVGVVKKWHIQEKECVSSYQLILEISVKDLKKLSDEQFQNMEVEILEDMYVAKILAQEGETVPVGKPIAVLVDTEDEIRKWDEMNFDCNIDAYQYEKGTKMALWQGYVKPSESA